MATIHRGHEKPHSTIHRISAEKAVEKANREVGNHNEFPEDSPLLFKWLKVVKKEQKEQKDRLYNRKMTPSKPAGTRRKVTSKKAAKKTCYPGYEVYNFRKTRKGVFYDCAPKRKTRRRI